MSWIYIVSVVFGYLLGSIPTGYLVGRRHGIDIREHGSRNIGATNVVRVLGKKPGYFVFFCDAIKGLLAVRLAIFWASHTALTAYDMAVREAYKVDVRMAQIFSQPLHTNYLDGAKIDARVAATIALAGILAGLACILGHNFPVWLRFKGGKGVATTVGVILGLMPVAFAVAAVVWTVSFFTTRYVSLASLLAAAVLPVAVWFVTRTAGPMFWFSVVAALLIIVRHRANIGRLLNGTEPRFSRKPSAPQT